jgi:hypothetical protein
MFGLVKKIAIILTIMAFTFPANADRIGVINSEADGTPGDVYVYKIIWPNGTISITDGVLTYTATYEGDMVIEGSVTIGSPNSTETTETPIWEMKIESDTATESVGNSLTQSMTDETDGTEDTVLYQYRMEAGALCVSAFYGPPMSAAPSWTPCTGCRVLSDGGGASPWDTTGGVYYTGAAWAAD